MRNATEGCQEGGLWWGMMMGAEPGCFERDGRQSNFLFFGGVGV